MRSVEAVDVRGRHAVRMHRMNHSSAATLRLALEPVNTSHFSNSEKILFLAPSTARSAVLNGASLTEC